MQSNEQVNNIIQHKIRQTRNKHTLKQMQSALVDIDKGDKLDKRYAILGLVLIVPIIIYLFKLFS